MHDKSLSKGPKFSRQYTQNLFDMLNSWLPSASGDISRARATLRLTGASAIHVRGMDKLTIGAVREIEQIHSSWIEFEVAGEDHSLMALCADDIELWPPDAQPVLGWAAVSGQLVRSTTRIYAIEITDRRIRGSNEIAYLTASYPTARELSRSGSNRNFARVEDPNCIVAGLTISVMMLVLRMVRVPGTDGRSDNDSVFVRGHGVLYVRWNEQEATNGVRLEVLKVERFAEADLQRATDFDLDSPRRISRPRKK
jgi:hypothetical protein